MRLVCISDLHCHLPHVAHDIPDGDVLLIAGDWFFFGRKDWWREQRFLDTEIAPWLSILSGRFANIVAIAGNHDGLFETHPHLVSKNLPWTYLQDSGCEINGLKIWGTPWTPSFCSWHFQADDRKQKIVADMIPDDTDIVLTHGPVQGILDVGSGFKRCGSKYMRERARQIKPILYVHGHIHNCHGWYGDGHTVFANCTLVDGLYKPVYQPLVFDIKDGRAVPANDYTKKAKSDK